MLLNLLFVRTVLCVTIHIVFLQEASGMISIEGLRAKTA